TAPAARATAYVDHWTAAQEALRLVLQSKVSLVEADLAIDLHDRLTTALLDAQAVCGHLGAGAVKVARKAAERRIRQEFAERLDRAGVGIRRELCAVFIDLVGDPLGPAVLKPAWLEADGGRVRLIAQAL